MTSKKFLFIFDILPFIIFVLYFSPINAQTDSIVINIGDFTFPPVVTQTQVVPLVPPFGTITDVKVSFDYAGGGSINANNLVLCFLDSVNQSVCMGDSGWFIPGSFNLGNWSFSGTASIGYEELINLPPANYLTNNGFLAVSVGRSTTTSTETSYNDLTITLFGDFSPPPVPTLGEWGFILLSMLLLLLATFGMKNPELMQSKNIKQLTITLLGYGNTQLLRLFLILSVIYLLTFIPLFVSLGTFTGWDIPLGLLSCSLAALWMQVIKRPHMLQDKMPSSL